MGWWDHVQQAPKDPITSVTQAFLSDPTPFKLNLGVVVLFSFQFIYLILILFII